MAKISSNNTISDYGTELTIIAGAGESLIVRDVHVVGSGGGYTTFFIDTSTQGYFRTSTIGLGNHLAFIGRSERRKTILGSLTDKGIFKGYPIQSGSKFTVKNTAPMRTCIVYDIYDAGDIHNTMENGKDSKELTFLMYGQPDANVNTATDTPITRKNNPSEFCDFPFRGGVATKRKIDLYGVVYSSRGADDGNKANYIHTKYLKLMKGRNVLFDSMRAGLVAQGKSVLTDGAFEAENGYDIGGEYSDLYQKDALIFDEPIRFANGEELDTYWTTEVAITAGTSPGTFTPSELEIAYILKETQE